MDHSIKSMATQWTGEDAEEIMQMRDLFLSCTVGCHSLRQRDISSYHRSCTLWLFARFANTNSYLLIVTFVVSVLHMIFEYLALKHDAPWKDDLKIMMSVAAEPILWQQCGNWGTLLAENWCRDIEAVCFIEGNIWWNCMHLGSCQTWFEFFCWSTEAPNLFCLFAVFEATWYSGFICGSPWLMREPSLMQLKLQKYIVKNQLMHERLSIALQPRYDQETGWLVLILMLGQIAVDCWKLTRVIEAWAHTNTWNYHSLMSWLRHDYHVMLIFLSWQYHDNHIVSEGN